MKKTGGIAVCLLLFLGAPTFAAHPLITDDAGVQGAGKFQIELNGQYSRDSDGHGVIEQVNQAAMVLTFGQTDTLDLAVGIPWQKSDMDDAGTTSSSSGLSDVAVSVKWRFYEQEGLSFALKPGITFPTGDFNKGLGNGKATASLFLISTTEIKPAAIHLNLGYMRNESSGRDRVNLWHASVAGEYAVLPLLRVVANAGVDTNPEEESGTAPAFLLGGVIYSVTENFDFDFGLKCGMNKAEPDITALAGVSLRW